MATTTLSAILAAMQSAVAAVPLAGGGTWRAKQGLEAPDDAGAQDSDNVFTFEFPEDRRTVQATGVGAVQVVQRRVHVLLDRLSGGDTVLDEATLDDDARAVADAVEGAAYPASTELVLVESQRVELRQSGYMRARLVVNVQFRAPYGG